MGVKLNTGLGGSITIDATNTASNVTATLPAVSGTVQVQNNIPAFSANITSGVNQTLTSGASTTVQFATKAFDTATCFNNTGSTVTLNGISTPAYSFAPNVAGYYMLVFTSSSNAINGETWAYINKNGSGYLIYDIQATNTYGQTGSLLIYANGTSDYFSVTVVQNSGSSKILDANTRFMGYLVRLA